MIKFNELLDNITYYHAEVSASKAICKELERINSDLEVLKHNCKDKDLLNTIDIWLGKIKEKMEFEKSNIVENRIKYNAYFHMLTNFFSEE